MPQQETNTVKKSALEEWLGRKKKATAGNGIQALDESIPGVLSHGQKRLWLLQQLFPENPFYQYSHLYRFEGKLNPFHLRESFEKVVVRHSILRTTFQETEEGPRQSAQPLANLEFKIEDLSILPLNQQQVQAKQIIKSESKRTFDLGQGPLLRLRLLKFSEDVHWLLLSIHHIIGDRWSLELINIEVAAIYQALQEGKEAPSVPLPFQYADYARYQQSQITDSKDEIYWLKKLAGDIPNLALPTDFPRPAIPSFQGAMVSRSLSPVLSAQIRSLSKDRQTTMFVVLLAAFKALLYRYTEQADILVGSPFVNRDKSSLEPLVGFFNETLVLRSALSPEMTFRDLIDEVKKTTLEALAHKNMPFDSLVQLLKPERQGGYNPLFQIMFLYNSYVPVPDFGTDLAVEEEMLDLGIAKFDLTLNIYEQGDHLTLSLEYAKDLFEATTIDRMLAHLEVMLQSIGQDPGLKLAYIPLLSAGEKQQILVDWNNTQVPPSEVTSIHQYLELQAKKYPERRAVIYEDQVLTYLELNKRAHAVAQGLLAAGVEANMPVGLYCDRSVEMLIGIFGILKAGAAYLPLDPEYPAERIQFMLADSAATRVLSQEKLISRFPEIAAVEMLALGSLSQRQYQNPLSLPEVQSQQLAYIIYTSGSTGLPKGVPITHRNLVHATSARFHFYPENPACFLLLSSFSFDSSVAGIFWTICSGGTLLLPKRRIEQDIAELSGLIEKHAVSHTLLLPSLYTLLLSHALPESLRSLQTVIVAGEACTTALVQQHFKVQPTARLYNEYGPTEASVWCIAHEMRPLESPIVPIGKPIVNTQAYILDKQLQAVPVGIAGELYIAGIGLAAGYHRRPELTQERFLPNPFAENVGEKMYKTGDLARYTAHGLIEFLGRADQQLKIRGHRVEPDEIAALLQRHPQVSEAVVVAQRQQDIAYAPLRLLAYVSGISTVEVEALRSFIQAKLPDYMVPSAFIVLDQFPRLPNGKVNRRVLPDPKDADFLGGSSYQAPRTTLENQLVDIWQEVLQLERIGINDNFFSIGGDSILSIRIVAKARNAGIQLAANQLFQHQTIAELASSLEDDPSAFSTLVPLKKAGTQTPLFCIHSGGGHVFFYQALANRLGDNRPVYALQPAGLDGHKGYHNSIKEMAAHYIGEIKALQAQGPYHILGTCFSNAVALEMGNQLQRLGDEVGSLFIIDSGPLHLLGGADWGQNATFKRFLDMLKRGDFYHIKRKILNRFRPTKITSKTWEAVSAESDLKETVEALNTAYAAYSWSPYPGKIHFIRSSEFADRPDKKYHLHQWQKLAKGGLEVKVVAGHHLTLFEEPEVQGLAQQLNTFLQQHTG